VFAALKSESQSYGNILIILIFGFLFRIVLLNQDPWFSDDVYRYLWDGKVSQNGVNPYQYPPDHEHLSQLQEDDIFKNLNYPEIATVYPPVAQFFFLLNAFLGGSLITWKIILLILELILTLILLRTLEVFNINKMRILIFSLNPLLIVETYMNGHLEMMGLLFLWLVIYGFYVRRKMFPVIFTPLAILVKFFPAIMVLPFLRPNLWKKVLFITAICVMIVLPFAASGVIPMAGFFSYINRWSFNGAVFKVVSSFIYTLPLEVVDLGFFNLNQHLERVFINQEFYYKIFAVIILLYVIYDQLRKSTFKAPEVGILPISASFVITATFLLLTPTLHPWYIIWIIPFLIFIPNWSWLLFTFLVQISYHVLHDYQSLGVWQEQTWILVLEYVPFYIILIWEYLDRRRIKGWFIS
jgi:hypothetical protein